MPALIDLVDPATFAGDEPVGVCAVSRSMLPGPIGGQEWSYLSGRLWSRLLKLGEAYELHFARVVEPIIDTVLAPEQCESLLRELEFLDGVISDPALHQAIGVISAEALRVTGKPDFRLVLSPP